LCPIASKANTISIRAKPGKKANHQYPEVIYLIDSDKITPIAGSSGGNPNPRNVIPASCNIACGNNSTAHTMN